MTPPGTSKTELLIFPENETFLRRFFRSIIATARLGHAPTLQYIVCNLPDKLEFVFLRHTGMIFFYLGGFL